MGHYQDLYEPLTEKEVVELIEQKEKYIGRIEQEIEELKSDLSNNELKEITKSLILDRMFISDGRLHKEKKSLEKIRFKQSNGEKIYVYD